jgi:glucokinase
VTIQEPRPPAAGGVRPPRPVLAIDIGGTKLAAGVLAPDGRIVASDSAPTRAHGSAEALFRDLVSLCDRILGAAGVAAGDVHGIGVGCGGPMVYPEGRVSPLNIPAWRGFPLRAALQERYDRPTRVDNDAKAFALGEHWLGGGRGARCLLGMVVSTGVGGGIVEDGRLIHGARGNAGHIGHVVAFQNGAPCECGARGCVEATASGTGLANRARRALARGVSTNLLANSTGADIAAAARRGDRFARRLMEEAGMAIGRGIAAAASLLDVDRVVIGGSVALGSGDLLLEPLRRELARNARLDFTRDVPVVLSELGVSAALAGAAALILHP